MKSVYFNLALLVLFCVPSASIATPPETNTPVLRVRYISIRKERAGRYDISVQYPVFAGSSPMARLANESLRAYAVSSTDKFIQQAESDYAEQGNLGPSNGYSLELKPTVSLAHSGLISVYFSRYTYMGGAHPNTEYPSQSFGIVGGKAKRLVLADLFDKNKDPYAALSSVALPKLKARGASSVTQGSIEKLDKEILRDWVITPRGITLLFAPYAVASYAEGAFITKIGFRELNGTWGVNGPLKGLLTQSRLP
ncbi:MAG: DUF3298 and DUF4163 domain-containing protein [Fibrella sp.]|nr:DUF3298 and DUF4163 domain-containing protein [Armatimonadota bacterium]